MVLSMHAMQALLHCVLFAMCAALQRAHWRPQWPHALKCHRNQHCMQSRAKQVSRPMMVMQSPAVVNTAVGGEHFDVCDDQLHAQVSGPHSGC
ncbi:hypothetical protein COO60DRAFT_1558439 [Scenedesmus sp. NREL 46B-D3]|nr:hypothetical protein COO60DRAFT_1558439 [Scenedesmus sp. NREL 46B-D3]